MPVYNFSAILQTTRKVSVTESVQRQHDRRQRQLSGSNTSHTQTHGYQIWIPLTPHLHHPETAPDEQTLADSEVVSGHVADATHHTIPCTWDSADCAQVLGEQNTSTLEVQSITHE